MLNRLKISLMLTPVAFLSIVGAYVYTLWAAEREKSENIPVDAAAMMMRDLLSYHDKNGGFPETLKELEGSVWEKKARKFDLDDRAFSHRNFLYFYSRLSHHRFALWAIPMGKEREYASTSYLLVTPDNARWWKGAAVPIDRARDLATQPTSEQLAVLGLIEQPRLRLATLQNGTSANQ